MSKLLKNSQQTLNLPARYDPLCPQCDWMECTCHLAPTVVTSGDIPMAEEVVMRVSPQEVCESINQEVKVTSGSSETSRELLPSYAVSGQCCTCTKGCISSSRPKLYQWSNYFLGQHLGLQSTIDLCCNWLCVKRTGSISTGGKGALIQGGHWGYIEVFKQFIHTLSRGYMVESFAMYPATTSWVLWGFMVKLNYIEVSLWLLWKEPPGDIVITLQDTFWKKSQWVAQTHGGHIAKKVVKEPRVFIQNVPGGYFGRDISKVQHVIKVGGTFQKSPACNPWVMCGHIA